MRQRIEALERKLRRLNIRGTIALINPAMGSSGCVKVAYGDNQISGWLPVKPVRSGGALLWWFPDVGEGVTVSDIENGEVTPGSFTDSMPPPTRDPNVFHIRFKNGDRLSHNSSTGVLDIVTKSEVNVTTKTASVNADVINATATTINSEGDWTHTGPMVISETLEVQAELNVLSTSQLVGMVTMPGGFISGGFVVPGVPAGAPGTGTMTGQLNVIGEVTVNGVKVSKHSHNDAEGRPVGAPY